MITENLSTLKIYKLTQEQYDKRVENGEIEANALYLTPDEAYGNIVEFQQELDKINDAVANITNGSTTVSKAESANTATNAEYATKATQDGNGEVISETYETKTDSQNKLTEAKNYTDTQISGHENNKDNPHNVTKEQLGLENVDNTSDMNKPVSTAQQAAIDLKADLDHNHNELYDSIGSSAQALEDAKEYADSKVADLLENSTEAVDSIYELRDAMNTNADAIEALTSIAGSKADKEHSHDDKYYTETEIDDKISAINDSIANISSGETVVKKAETATSATSATQDATGNVITDTYETKDDASAKLTEAKGYTDTAIENLNISKDYEQNDETHPEYIKNRPFYTGDDILELANSGEFTDTDTSGWDAVPFLKEGVTYKVVWNDQEYECVCESVNNMLQLGNITIRSESVDTTKEPFLFQDWYGMITKIYNLEPGTYTYSVYKKSQNIKTLDRKYIPYVAGEKVEGRIFEYNGNRYKGGVNAEIFNDYVGNIATGNYSHVEGCNNIANHWYTHAEGLGVKASGSVSHSEGAYTVSTGASSHAEGSYTIAASGNQHVQGTYNIEDAEGRYAHIVGNGDSVYDSATQSSNITRSNAHTVDWDGNGWFAGNLYVGGTSQDNAMPLTTVQIIRLEADE